MKPELHIAYSSDFALKFRYSKAEFIVSVGQVNWRFDYDCAIHHSKGNFIYESKDLFFPREAFERFHHQLGSMREGKSTTATLADEGQMVSFALKLEERKLKSTVQIREYQAGNDLSTLSAGFWVDYDLFVNKLYADLGDFIAALRNITPAQV